MSFQVVTVGPPVMIATAKALDSDEITKRQAQGLFKHQQRSQKLKETGNIEI
jgi:hypothetical protein